MYMLDDMFNIGSYEDIINEILQGDDNMATNRYGFSKMTLSEFKEWLHQQSNFDYDGIQIHHTGAPSYKNFYKADGTHEDELTRQNNMKAFHVKTNGWSDIAQHFTIFPNGVVVTGRPLSNTTPVGISGWNSKKICIEIYGNFDKGGDIMSKEQKDAVVAVYGELCKKFKITPSLDTIRCHAWFDSKGKFLGTYIAGKSRKTCPGTNFMGVGNSKEAIRDNFIPLIKNYINGENNTTQTTVDKINYTTGLYKVNTDSLNIRKGPGVSYDCTGSLKKGDVYTITEVIGNWGRLKSGIGWINLNYTIQMSSTSTTTNNSKYTTGLYKINTDTLNIRKGPGMTYDIVGSVVKNYVYTISKVTGSWGYLKSGIGWINLDYTIKK